MATYYVATTGSDTTGNGTIGLPYRTITKGVSVMVSGDTLYIRGGTYDEGVGYPNAYFPPSGASWASPTTIAGYTGETVILLRALNLNTGNGRSYVVFDNLTVDAHLHNIGAYLGTDSHHIRIIRCDIKNGTDVYLIQGQASFCEVLNSLIHNAGEGSAISSNGLGSCYAFYVNGHDNLYEGNSVYDCGGYGYHIYRSGAIDVSNNIVRNNRIYNNGKSNGGIGITCAGIIISSGVNNLVYNNLIYDNSNGLQIDYSPAGAAHKVYNNTIYANIGFGITNGTDGALIKNNIVYGNGSEINNLGTNTTFAANLSSSTGPAFQYAGNPLFVNPATFDLHIQAGSPAIDRGVTV